MDSDQETRDEGSNRQQQFDADPRAFIEAATRIYMAGMATSGKAWMEWAQYASSYATRCANYPQWINNNPDRAGEWYGRLMDDSREYLRMMTELPTQAAAEYRRQVEEIMREFAPRGAGNRPRAAGSPETSEKERGGDSAGEEVSNRNPNIRRTRVKE